MYKSDAGFYGNNQTKQRYKSNFGLNSFLKSSVGTIKRSKATCNCLNSSFVTLKCRIKQFLSSWIMTSRNGYSTWWIEVVDFNVGPCDDQNFEFDFIYHAGVNLHSAGALSGLETIGKITLLSTMININPQQKRWVKTSPTSAFSTPELADYFYWKQCYKQQLTHLYLY